MSQLFTNSVTISTTEISLTGGTSTILTQTTSGIVQLVLGLQNLVSGDVFKLKIYEKVRAASTQYAAHQLTITGAQATPVMIVASPYLANGWDFTLIRMAGSDRVIEWSVRQVAVS